MKRALVLSGGGARGAYEVGVLAYLFQELAPRLGRPLRFELISGTSVGAVNACHLAAGEDEGEQTVAMCEAWSDLRLDSLLALNAKNLTRLALSVLRRPGETLSAASVLDARGLARHLLCHVQWPKIGRAVRAGRLEALTVTATHVATGHSVIFVQRKEKQVPVLGRDPNLLVQAARIGPRHVLASCAIPVLFPPVELAGELYLDGGLRLNVPFGPAIRLGAEKVAVVALQPVGQASAVLTGAPTPASLAGKVFNAVMQENVEQDFDRLRRLNEVLEAGTAAYGDGFLGQVNAQISRRQGLPVRRVETMLQRPSRPLGEVAWEATHSPAFVRTPAGAALRAVADREDPKRADLTSYLLFDGTFARELISLGRADARKNEEAWARFFA